MAFYGTENSSSLYLPCGAILANSLSRRNNGVFIIAGTVCTGHTLPFLIHVGSLSTATAIYCGETGLAGVVSLTEGMTRATAARHVVLVDCFYWA